MSTRATAAISPCATSPTVGASPGHPWPEQMSRKMLRNVEKRRVQAARTGPSLPPTPAGGPVAKAEMSTADRLGSRGVVTRSCGCTCYDLPYDKDVTQCATTGTPPRRADRAIRRCEALGRVAPGDFSPGAPTDPYVPFQAYGSSHHERATGRHTEWIATGGGSGYRPSIR